jgi:hypothetical protein
MSIIKKFDNIEVVEGIDLTKPYNSATLIHDKTVMVDLGFTHRNKQYLLNRIQFWKNWYRRNNFKRIMVASDPTMDSICMLFAAAETGVVLLTGNLSDGVEPYMRRSAGAEHHFINPYFTVDWLDFRHVDQSPIAHLPITLMHENEFTRLFEEEVPTYVPEYINNDNTLIIGEVTGVADTRVANTCFNFLYGGVLSMPLYEEGDRFGSANGITHLGLVTKVVLAPLYKGVTFYTVQNFYDLVFMARRGLFTKLWFYDIHLKLTEWHPNFSMPIDCFKGCTIFCGGTKPSPKLMDHLFEKGGAKNLISFYGTFMAAGPIFLLDIPNRQFDVYNASLGIPSNGTLWKIVDGQLWVKSPCQNPHAKVDADGYFNTFDYVKPHPDGGCIFMGRDFRTLENGDRVFGIEIQDSVQWAIDEDLFYGEYQIELPPVGTDTFNLYPLSKVSKRVLEKNQDKILTAVQSRLEDPGITKIVIHKIVADANLFQGRIMLSRIKQLLAKGIVHEY